MVPLICIIYYTSIIFQRSRSQPSETVKLASLTGPNLFVLFLSSFAQATRYLNHEANLFQPGNASDVSVGQRPSTSFMLQPYVTRPIKDIGDAKTFRYSGWGLVNCRRSRHDDDTRAIQPSDTAQRSRAPNEHSTARRAAKAIEDLTSSDVALFQLTMSSNFRQGSSTYHLSSVWQSSQMHETIWCVCLCIARTGRRMPN